MSHVEAALETILLTHNHAAAVDRFAREAADAMLDGLLLVTRPASSASLGDATIDYCNAAVERRTGFVRSDIVGKPLSWLAPGIASFDRAAGSPAACAVALRDGGTTMLDVDVRPIGARGGERCAVTLRDPHTADVRFRSLFEANPAPMWVYDVRSSSVLAANEEARRRYGAAELDGLSSSLFADDQSVERCIVKKHAVGDGSVIDVELHAKPVFWNERPACLVIANDVTDRLQLLDALRRSENVLASAQQTAQLGSWDFDYASGQLFCSDELYELFGRPASPPFSRMEDLWRLVHPEDVEFVRRSIREAANSGIRYHIDHRILRGDGLVRWVSQHGQCALDDGGNPRRLVGTVIDITERKEAEQRLAFLAHHDSLTSLPNRTLLVDRLSQAITFAQRNKRLAAVLFLDLDNFKSINDTLGHVSGDNLLRAVAQRLRSIVRAGDIVARPAGDEFIIVLTDVARIDVVAKLSQKVIAAFGKPFAVEDGELFVNTSIGVSIYPFDGEDVETLIRNADTAMYQAKDRGRNNFQLYTPNMHAAALRRLGLENDLRRALAKGELVLHYQPIVNIASGAVIAVEALVRWRHPTRGLLAPADFIPLAEETGLIVPIGEWVLRTACRQAQTWKPATGARLRLSVNVSARQFAQPKLLATVADALRDSLLQPTNLELELGENAFSKDPDNAQRMIGGLKNLGVRIAVAQFGSGYNSLEQLKQHPIDALKIDRAFVSGIDSSPSDQAIAASLVTLARGLKLRTTAVGVERQDQLAWLSRLRCDEMQGFVFSAPVPADEVAPLLDASAARALIS